jgi:hypothetical protein
MITRKNAIILYAVLTVLLVLASPFLFMAFVFGLAGGMNAISSGRNEGYSLVFLGLLPVYPLAFVLYGWLCIFMKTPLHWGRIFLIPVGIWFMIGLFFLFF